MSSSSSSFVREMGSVVPCLHPSVRFIAQESGGKAFFVLEDNLKSKYHRIGLAEYRLIRKFDGKMTFTAAVAMAAIESGPDALSERDALTVLAWLVENNLVDLGGAVPLATLRRESSRGILSRISLFTNILSIRIPLGNPDRVMRLLYRKFRFLSSPWFLLLWLPVVFSGLMQVAVHSGRLKDGTAGILAPDNWLPLLAVWIFVKIWHELMHGLAAIRYGGSVREAGILLILFMPLGYVDATSSLAFPSKWQRMHVAAAGMYGELFLAGLAAITWSVTDPGLLNTIAFNAMITASLVTILFNMNPLMRFDGYYILADLVEIPNLATRSSRLLGAVCYRWFLGNPDGDIPEYEEGRRWVYFLYGIAACLWKVLITATLLTAAALFFQGGGFLFAVSAALWMIVPFALRLFNRVRYGLGNGALSPRRAVIRCGGAIGLVALILFAPWRTVHVVPGLFRYMDEDIYRVELAGFVRLLHAGENDWIPSGTRMLEMENPETSTRLALMRKAYSRQQVKVRMAQLSEQPAEAATEEAKLKGMDEQIAELTRFIDTLVFDARRDGLVLTPMSTRHPGQFFRRGDEILRVADPGSGEVVIPVSLDAMASFQRHIGRGVRVRADGRFASRKGRLVNISGRAVTSIDYPELTAVAGGRLAVRPATGADGSSGYELLDPVCWGSVRLEQDAGSVWRSGERVRVKFRSSESTRLGQLLVARIRLVLRHVATRASARG